MTKIRAYQVCRQDRQVKPAWFTDWHATWNAQTS